MRGRFQNNIAKGSISV